MPCQTNTGQDILEVVEILQKDTDLLRRFVQGEDNETVPLGEPIATPTPTLRHLAKNVLDAIDYFMNQWSKAADPLALDSYAFNVRRSRILQENIPAGSIVTLPVTYYPGRDILLVSYRGQILTPRKQDDWNPGERQYEEVAGPDVPQGGNASNFPSDKIIISFDMDQGSSLDCWVVASNLIREMGVLLAARDAAVQAAETATEQAAIATQERETIEKLVGESVLELGVANIDCSFRADKDYASGDVLTLPLNYYPRRAVLVLTYKGQVCTPYKLGQSDNYMYREVGTDPTVKVNEVIVEFDVKQGDPFYVMVWASSTGRNIDIIRDLALDVQAWSSNAALASQSVFNKADKYYATIGSSVSHTLRSLTSGIVITHLDFSNVALPGSSIFQGRITFTDNESLVFDVDDIGQTRFTLRDAADNVIQLFYAQASGWAVTSTWAFVSEKTVAIPVAADMPPGPSLWDVVLGIQMTGTMVDPQYNFLNKPQRDELQSLVTDVNYGTTGSTVTVSLDVYNALLKQASVIEKTYPIVSAANAGAMPAETYSALEQALIDIEALKLQGGRYIGQGFQTKAELDAFVIPSFVNFGDFTYVEHDETQNNATTRYICVDVGGGVKQFLFAYVIQEEPYGIASPTVLGLVKGTPGNGAPGKIYVELDGTQTVIGWDAQTTAIQNNATQIQEIWDYLEHTGGHVSIGTTAPVDTEVLWVNMADFCCYAHNGTKWVRLTGVYQENAGV